MRRDMEKTEWKVYKSRHTRQWVVWNTGWPWSTVDTLKFDTWQQAIDYVYGKGRL